MSPRHLLRPLCALALCLCAAVAPAQTFYSPAYANGQVPDGETIFQPEWIVETTLMARRSSPTLADFDGNGSLEIIFGTLDGRLHVLDSHTGQEAPNWPQQLSAPIDSTPAVGDVDGDGQPEIIATCGVADSSWVPRGAWGPQANGALYVFNADGTVVTHGETMDWWNMATGVLEPDGFTEGIIANPAVGDIDGDGVDEIVAGGFDFFLYAINAVGGAREVNAAGTVDRMNLEAQKPFIGSVYRLDADNDGRWDEDPPGDWTPFPHGNGLPGFAGVDDDGDGLIDELGIDVNGDGYPEGSAAHPMDDDEDSDHPLLPAPNMALVDEDALEWPHFVSDTIWGSPALCDLDGDGQLDVIQPADYSDQYSRGRLHVLSGTSVPLLGWLNVDLPSLVWTPISCADVDHDGTVEIFMGTNSWWHPDNPAWGGGHIFGLNHDGTEIRDGDCNPATFGIFAQTEPSSGYFLPGQKPYVMGAPALGNLDDDADLEIVVGSYSQTEGHIWAWNPDGSLLPGFPISSQFGANNWGPIFNGVTLADIDGDGDIEIIALTGHAFLVAYHHDGTPVQGTPFWGIDLHDGRGVQFFGAFQSMPAVGDVDNDGLVEIVFTGRDHSILGDGRGLIVCIEAGPYNPMGMEWPMMSANAQNTGVYREVEELIVPGDVNEDGEVNIGDLVRMRNALSGEHPVDPTAMGYINGVQITGDAEFTEADLNALIDMLLGR
jgi:FG-GAP-like repeat/Dockerin type I domain